MLTCTRCQTLLQNRQKLYCSNSCQITYQYEQFIAEWQHNSSTHKNTVVTKNISKHLKRFLIEKAGERCSQCGWKQQNQVTGKVPLEVDHIDGNSDNNTIQNLQLLCPNCHSLTPHYRNLNRGHGRSWRHSKYK